MKKNPFEKRSVRDRLFYLAALILLLAAGLAVRKWHGASPNFFNTYFPDAAWAMAVYGGFGMVFDLGPFLTGGIAAGTAYLIEVSQLFHPAWLDAVRSTTLGGLVLGFGFLWSDIACYTVGIALFMTFDFLLRRLIREKKERFSENEQKL